MTKREIVMEAICHRPTPFIPYAFSLTSDMSKMVEKQTGETNLPKKSGSFIVGLTDGAMEQPDPHHKRDQFGVTWLMDQRGDFGVVDKILLPEPTLDNYAFPEPNEADIRRKCEWLVSKENAGLFTMFGIGFSLFERAWSLRGMENLLMDFILEPDFADQLFDRICEYNLKVIQIALEYPIDCIYFGDDWGQQRGMIMGPKHWRRFLKPHLAKMYSLAKSHGKYICQHSCGDIHEVFPEVIEIGLDIYNTFQPEIYDVAAFKKEFGDSLTIYGGISTQHILPHGTPEQVRIETRRMMDILGQNGGYICAPTHAVPYDVPLENLMAFIETVQNQ